MKEVKLFIDTSALDQVQASMNRVLSEFTESRKADADLIAEVDQRIDRIFDELTSRLQIVVKAELKTVISKEFDKLVLRLIQNAGKKSWTPNE
jgi:restriction endonuclease Mrr